MKLNTRNVTKKSGMTLLELTVVILVLLSLISILFIGARAWKKGADRSGCILNIRNFQQAVRSYSNMNQIDPEESTPSAITLEAAVVGSGSYMEVMPTCPGGGTYSGQEGTTIPKVGTIALKCTITDHAPAGNTKEW